LSKRIIIFAPHPDDETIGCGGTIVKKMREGFEVTIVLLTDGRHDKCGAALGLNAEQVKKARSEEFENATAILGVARENLLKLDFEDTTLKKHEEEAKARVVEILRKYPPVEAYFPLLREAHPDHQVTNRIVRASVRSLGLPCRKYQFPLKHKYSLRVGPYIEKALGLIERNMIKVDISDFLYLKEKAWQEYKVIIASSRQKEPLRGRTHSVFEKYETFYICK
jgi:LmbE family N-acetylglucosaminyl deacetylase